MTGDAGKSHLSHRERDTNYCEVVFVKDGWRVIVCKDGIQWIIQRRWGAEGSPKAEWRGLHYCVTRKALVRLWEATTGYSGSYLGATLPERFRPSNQ